MTLDWNDFDFNIAVRIFQLIKFSREGTLSFAGIKTFLPKEKELYELLERISSHGDFILIHLVQEMMRIDHGAS